jgi:hypothetical protein
MGVHRTENSKLGGGNRHSGSANKTAAILVDFFGSVARTYPRISLLRFDLAHLAISFV